MMAMCPASFTSTVTEWISEGINNLDFRGCSFQGQPFCLRLMWYNQQLTDIFVLGVDIMYCEQCGSFIQDGEAFCTNCGAPAPAAKPAPAPGPEPAPGPVVQPIPAQPIEPVNQQPVQPVYQHPAAQPVQPIYQTPAYMQQGVVITPFERQKSNAVAIVGMVFGIITSVLFWLPVINLLPGIVGIVCSSIGLAQKNSGKGQAIAGLITSIAGILLGFMILGLAMMDGNY